MNEQELDTKIKELIIEIAIPSKNKQKQSKKSAINNIQRSFADLRICVKYLMFDLEATRRERDHLKTRINNGDDSSGHIEGEI